MLTELGVLDGVAEHVMDGVCDGVCDGVWLFGTDSFEECPLTLMTSLSSQKLWKSIRILSDE